VAELADVADLVEGDDLLADQRAVHAARSMALAAAVQRFAHVGTHRHDADRRDTGSDRHLEGTADGRNTATPAAAIEPTAPKSA